MPVSKVTEPKFTQAEADKLIGLYAMAQAEIEDKLSIAMTKAALEHSDPTRVTTYLQGMKENVDRILLELEHGTTQWSETQLPALYKEATAHTDEQMASLVGQMGGVDKAIAKVQGEPDGIQKDKKLAALEAIKNGRPVGFGFVHQQAVAVLASNLANTLGAARVNIGRRVDDIHRELTLDAIRGTVMGYDSWAEAARRLRGDLDAEGITAFTDKAGRSWSLKRYAEMAVRSTTMETTLAGTAIRLAELGATYVRVSTHVGSCPMCYFYQGAVLSLDGQDPNVPSLEQAKMNGLFHPNCKHAYGFYDPSLLDPTGQQYEDSRWLAGTSPQELQQVHSLLAPPPSDLSHIHSVEQAGIAVEASYQQKQLADYLIKQHAHEAGLFQEVKTKYNGDVGTALAAKMNIKAVGLGTADLLGKQVETLKKWKAAGSMTPWPKSVMAKLLDAVDAHEANIEAVKAKADQLAQAGAYKGGGKVVKVKAAPPTPTVATPAYTPKLAATPAPAAQKVPYTPPATPKPKPSAKAAKLDPFTKHDADWNAWIKPTTSAGREWVSKWSRIVGGWQSSAQDAYKCMLYFTGSGYRTIAPWLRTHQYLRTEKTGNNSYDALTKAMNETVLEEGIVVSRKFGGMFLKDEWGIDLTDPAGAVGKCYIDYSFASSAIHDGVWSGTTRTTVYVPPGPGRGCYVADHSASGSGEKEFLLNRATVFRVVDVNYVPGRGFDVKLEVLDAWPKGLPAPEGKKVG